MLYTPECIEDLRNRRIRPSIHSAHTGLNEVWTIKDGQPIFAPNVIGRCIYRRAKGDGDSFVSDVINLHASAQYLTRDDLFKITKRFFNYSNLLVACIEAFHEIGVDPQMINSLRNINMPNKPSRTITSILVEDMLAERVNAYSECPANANQSLRANTQVVFQKQSLTALRS